MTILSNKIKINSIELKLRCSQCYVLITLISISLITSCKPEMKGDLRMYNESSQIIYVKYSNNERDTITKRIDPGTDVLLKILDGPGNARSVECCPCQSHIYSVYSALRTIKKDVSNRSNWNIPNRNKLRKYGKEPVKCEFHVQENDL